MRRAALLIALAAALLSVPASLADPGVTPTSVKLGGTVPLTGEAAPFGSVGPGAKAYFDYVNSKGGVNGRKIEYVYYDDAYDPAQTVQLTRKLVEQDQVFAIFNSVGTANNIAIRPYLNELKVPQLFAGDGSDALGKAIKAYPWTVPGLMSYSGEGAIYGRYLTETKPKAKIAVLYENTEYGKDLLKGLQRALKKGKIVAKVSYEYTDSDISSHVAKLKSFGADTFMVFGTPKFAIQSFVAADKLNWRPQFFISAISIEPSIMAIARIATGGRATKNAISTAFLKNPTDPVWNKDPSVVLYRQIMKKFLPSGKATDVYNFYGMAVAWTMVETLRKAGKKLTRASVLAAARSLDLVNPFFLPGLSIKTSPTIGFPLAQVKLYRYDNAQWVKMTEGLDARG